MEGEVTDVSLADIAFRNLRIGSACRLDFSPVPFHSGLHMRKTEIVQRLRLFKRWIAGTIHWISIRETDYVIHWIEIYPVDSVIHVLNNELGPG